ncbi:phosphoribosylaminoimidazolesuccinocarboxamide synthase [Anaerobacillus alkalidiazotrophicus]|uniref:Phosphoribosylaminoimidazole-succinocarboxamide synthase n=1 Tax=Anaerobacillus alkalidiazotrophicus TaxID=472963 RepID=A0A1S2M298_9BACI|nr:phosphoribosylaminoimidazolesuccinocarboxamide synthase [Anaerobacillus alkalidiazotrophicus]OIJ18640.1 phosphoribosylaminoimidazolesuccinocarboxamide synthase [Anaerobacillus alkalidiazotrophicus]
MNKNGLLYEGKAKKIYQTDDQDVLWIEYKDDATAFNGEKKDKIAGKSRLNNLITSQIFQSLKEAGINNHFIENLSDTEQLVRKVTIIPLEVVVRNVAAGSLSKRLGLEEGVQLNTTIVELYYKDDALGDPLINEDHIRLLDIATPEQLEIMKTNALKVNEFLLKLFKEINVRLIDFKLEFGITDNGEVLLADEISPDTCRLWDMETNQKFDKDLFRRNLGSLTEGYEEILTRLGGTSNV